jgi:hypothetical protein
MILSESVFNTVALYMILKKMMTPFEKWDAYKLGIIDKNGKKIKEPQSSKERESWDLLTKFVWNFKKITMKLVGKSDFATNFSVAYLLSDSINMFYFEHNRQKLTETLLNNFTSAKQLDIFNILESLPKLQEKITEENIETLFWMYYDKICRQLDEKGIDEDWVK